MLPSHGCCIYEIWMENGRAGLKSLYGGKLKGKPQSQGGDFFIEHLNPQVFFQNYPPISAFLGLIQNIPPR